jgi:hypothetical protein
VLGDGFGHDRLEQSQTPVGRRPGALVGEALELSQHILGRQRVEAEVAEGRHDVHVKIPRVPCGGIYVRTLKRPR